MFDYKRVSLPPLKQVLKKYLVICSALALAVFPLRSSSSGKVWSSHSPVGRDWSYGAFL